MPKLDKRKHISDRISILRSSLTERRKLSRERHSAMQEQLKAKKQLERQYARRSAMDPGNASSKSEQQYEFRLWSARLREMQQEIRNLEKEIEIKKREDELEIRILEQELQQAQSELRIYADQNINENLIKLAHIAIEEKNKGNIVLSSKIFKHIKNAQILLDDLSISGAITRSALDPKKKSS